MRFAVLIACLVSAAEAAAAERPSVLFGFADYPFVFRDVGDEAGIFPHLAGIRGHAAAWGDVDGHGWPSLFVGTFHNSGSKPSALLRNDKGKFRLDGQGHLRTSGIASGALFVDLTNRGRLDLYVSNNADGKGGGTAAPSLLFRNDGGGKFTDVSRDSGACPPGFLGRGVAALDFDGDGLVDLLVCESYYGTRARAGVALYRNKGSYRFEDVAKAAGLPAGKAVTSAAVADVNGDGWPDVFLVFADGNNRLYLNDGRGKFREAPGTAEVFRWKEAERAKELAVAWQKWSDQMARPRWGQRGRTSPEEQTD
jgi:enediyne biosynthesis protein E4